MNGIVNFIKPPGMTSNGAVVFLRRVLNTKKIGHTGTLDPGAAGVLPICIGRATRLSDYIMGHQKTYLAEACFGVATDTLDAHGTITKRNEKIVKKEELLAALPHFTGKILQVPPMYSALKINGRKMYELARKGIAVEKPPREVTIYSFRLLEQCGKNRYLFEIVCSKGTYIRTLLADLAEALGTYAYTSFLLRTASGGFLIENGYTADEIQHMEGIEDRSFLLSPEAALLDLPAVHVAEQYQKLLLNGVSVRNAEQTQTLSRIYSGGKLVGIGKSVSGGLKIQTLLTEKEEEPCK